MTEGDDRGTPMHEQKEQEVKEKDRTRMKEAMKIAQQSVRSEQRKYEEQRRKQSKV
jgi:hypothetical protein